MTVTEHAPARTGGMADLVADCHEVNAVLHLVQHAAPAPTRQPAAPAVIDLDAVNALDGWGTYGS